MRVQAGGSRWIRWVGLTATAVLAAVALSTAPARPAAAANVGPPAPFTSWDDFVDQQERDLLPAPSLPDDQVAAIASLSSGALTPAAYLAGIRTSADHLGSVDPVVRLYRAFFLRIPDRSGLMYWVAARRSGRWTLGRIAGGFAASSEFTNRYGTLSNREFVLLIYANVLERSPDAGGVAFWTKQLDLGGRTRGTVMVGFSESNEYRSKQASEATASVLPIMLLGRSPSTEEFQAAVARLDGGGSAGDEAAAILATPEYTARAQRTRVVVFGDSVPMSLIRNGSAGTDLSGYALANGAVPACDGVDHPPPSRTVTGDPIDISPLCATGWSGIYPPQLLFRTDRAIVMTGPHAMLDHLLGGVWKHPCHAAARTWYHDDLVARLTYLATRADRVVLVLPAWPGPNSGWVMPADYTKRADCVRQEMKRAAADTHTPTIDLGTRLCPTSPTTCLPYRDADGVHIDVEDSATVLTWMLAASGP